jgi:hypothetical protein
MARRTGRRGGRLDPRAYGPTAPGRWLTARASAAGTQSDDTPLRPLLAQTAPSLAMKRPLLSAFLLAVALEVMAPGSSSEKKECAR